MASPDALPRPRGLRVLLAALAGLVLAFGGTCGAGPTSLSLLAVAGTQTPSPADARGQVPVPAVTEVVHPARRRVLRRTRLRIVRACRVVRRAVDSWEAGAVAQRAPPPLRGPPSFVV